MAIFEIAKNEIWPKNFLKKLIYLMLMSFFAPDFFKFSGPLCPHQLAEFGLYILLICFSSFQSHNYDSIEETASIIRQKIQNQPKLGIICGSGLGEYTYTVDPSYLEFFGKISNSS